MQIRLNVTKTVEQNAALYYERAKKARKKSEGAKKALAENIARLERLKKEAPKEEVNQKFPEGKREWYEKFHWFISSDGFLCIGGRDATTNEIIIKKHTEKHDLVFHTEIAGSPFFVIKTHGRVPGQATIEEAAQATASYSRAWRLGLVVVEVYYITPEQVSKEAKPGEYLAKGAFMIYGKKTYLRPKIELAVGIKEGKIIGGAVNAVKANTEKFVLIEQGKDKASDAAKQIQKRIGGELDGIIAALPAGGCAVK